MKKKVHVISHSHWDREWYMPFEKHRIKLVELIDDAMELFEKDLSYKSFHLDGQTIVLDDYLEIKPQNRDKLKQYAEQNRFVIGPWYILQDEFLTSGEANVRNLLTGRSEAKEFGGRCNIGYFPDAFGNAGQMPQLLSQAGMSAVVFGRGVKPVGFNNQLLEGGAYESPFSEMKWESPDGTALLGILFANWYNNGSEIPVEEKQAKAYWDERLPQAEKYASTRHLLFMNGCDHQPVQKDLSEALDTARSLYPDIEFVHSDFPTYIAEVAAELDERIATVKGELTSQETDGRFTLVNTCSARVDLKQKNRKGEMLLEAGAEPASVLAMIFGKEYPQELLQYAWKKLMQNHPHDSICSCSVDEVNAEIATRFEKSRQVAEEILSDALSYLSDRIDTKRLGNGEEQEIYPIVVYNWSGWERTGVVEALVDLERIYGGSLTENYKVLEKKEMPRLLLKDAEGNCIAADISSEGVKFGYDLPDDRFRQPYMAKRVRVTFEADKVPALGYRAYYLTQAPEALQTTTSLVTGERRMENAYCAVEIAEDGSYCLTEKQSGAVFEGIGFYEDTGDIGNEYIYIQSADGKCYSTKGMAAELVLKENSPYRAVYEIRHSWQLPESADETLAEEQARFEGLYQRQAGRSKKTAEVVLTTTLTLEKSARGVKVETTIDNKAKDHRIRVLFPTGLKTDTHFADSMFEVVRRNNRHSAAWQNPSACEHQQSFVALQDERAGLLVANLGLYEYEILPEQDNTIAVTLLRSVGEMGDWGVFPAPAAQLQDTLTLCYEVIPFAAENREAAVREGYQYQTRLLAKASAVQDGELPAEWELLQWEGEGLHLTGVKKKEDGEEVIFRFVNHTDRESVLHLQRKDWMKDVYKSNVMEEFLESLTELGGHYELTVRPAEIVTVGVRI